LVIPEKTRLEKLLGMLGSSFDGERANAARMISAMAENQGLTVVELIYGVRAQEYQGRRQQKPRPKQPKDDPRAEVMPNAMLKALAEIANDPERYEFVLTEWEFRFALDVSARYSRDYELSAKQLAVVENIIRKARRATAQKNDG
jgi:hypothetical protein